LSERWPRILFVPVSGQFGMGEYARSLAIANGVAARWPGGEVHFMLSRAAPYAATCPHAATLLESSATFHSARVIERITVWRPDVVIFDNAGRTAQLRAARRCGARVVYISARPRQRRKAFRLRWMRLIDEHWIAYPEFIAGSLGFVERLKLRLLGRPQVRYLDVILSRAAAGATDEDCASLPARLGLSATKYVLLVPGGGTGHPGAGDAVQQFVTAARGLAAGGVTAVLVGQGPAGAADSPPPLRLLGALPQSELAQLMRGARLVVANGGSTLLQAIACGRACIAVPIAGDQRERIRRCEQAGVAVAAALDARSIEDAAGRLLADARALEAQAARAVALGLADGVGVALRALEALVANRPRAQ
jgi:spore coat polysaccharide biosynthesis predicted glycosyltransferase SpsG